MKMILDLFAGGHSVTVVADDGFSAASASSTSDVQKNADVTLTLTLGSGKMLDSVEALSGGVTITESSGTYGFKMGEADVVIVAKSKANNKYLVTEECVAFLNGAKTELHKNAKVVLTPNGVPKAVEAEGGGASVTVNAAIQELIDQGILVQI